jgi:hypothetical protein
MTRSRGDVCVKCGETRGAIMNEKLICWDGYDELGKHRFAAAIQTGKKP